MGVGGAAKLIANAQDNPQAVGARLFPNAASANRSIFYARDGRARSVSEVYSVLDARYASASNAKSTRSALAMYGDTPSTTQVATANGVQPSVPVIDNAAYLQTFPDKRAVTPVAVASPTRRCRQCAGRTGVPLDLPARRRHATGLNHRAETVGQQRLADLGRLGDAGRAASAAARFVQRPRRHVLELTLASLSIDLSRAMLRAKNAQRRARSALAGAGSLNKTSIKPACYGERFVKRRGLFCLSGDERHQCRQVA